MIADSREISRGAATHRHRETPRSASASTALEVKPAAKTAPPPFCVLPIKAVPNAPRSEICGWLGDAVKIKIHAPPVEGRANEVLCDFLAEQLKLPRRAVSVQHGDTSRQKLVRIEGLTLAEARLRLGL